MKTSDGSTYVDIDTIQAGLWKKSAEPNTSETPAVALDAETPDEELMRLCQKGRQDALEQLYQRHYRAVLMFILRIIQNRELAEDLVQETFVRVMTKRDYWQPRSKFTSWLYQIARNLCIDEKRRYWNRQVHMDSQLASRNQFGQSSLLDNVVDNNSDAREHFASKIDEETIKKAINQLSPEQREVIILNKYQGMSYNEIAEILDASPESIKQRAYRAHLKLRQILLPVLHEYA